MSNRSNSKMSEAKIYTYKHFNAHVMSSKSKSKLYVSHILLNNVPTTSLVRPLNSFTNFAISLNSSIPASPIHSYKKPVYSH